MGIKDPMNPIHPANQVPGCIPDNGVGTNLVRCTPFQA
jgi:hypothetical protein